MKISRRSYSRRHMSVYMTNGQLHRLFPSKLQKSGVNLVPLYQQKVYKMTILKLLHHLIPRSDAGIEKLVMFSGRSTAFTVKKNISQLKGKQHCDSDSFGGGRDTDKSVEPFQPADKVSKVGIQRSVKVCECINCICTCCSQDTFSTTLIKTHLMEATYTKWWMELSVYNTCFIKPMFHSRASGNSYLKLSGKGELLACAWFHI